MKLNKYEIKIDQETYEPYIELHIKFDYEGMRLSSLALPRDEYERIVGKEIIEMYEDILNKHEKSQE